MQSPRERYLTDPHFHALVELMAAHIRECNYTPSEMREAAVLASIIYEQNTVKYLHCPSIPKSVVDGLEVLHTWANGELKNE